MGWGSAPRKRSSAILIDEHVTEMGMCYLPGKSSLRLGRALSSVALSDGWRETGGEGWGWEGGMGGRRGAWRAGWPGRRGRGTGIYTEGGQREGTRPTICELIRSRGDAAVDGAPKGEGRTPVWK